MHTHRSSFIIPSVFKKISSFHGGRKGEKMVPFGNRENTLIEDF